MTGNWDDSSYGNATAQFFVQWFKLFPEYRRNALYLTGESYAGVGHAFHGRACICGNSKFTKTIEGMEPVEVLFSAFADLFGQVYLSVTAREILANPSNGISIKGVAIGDGCT